MQFNFSIKHAFKQSWQSFVRHPLFYCGLAVVMVIFNLFSNEHHQNWILLAVVFIAAIVWSYVWISVALAAVDGKEDLLRFKSLSVHMPNVRQFFIVIVLGIIVAIVVAAGFILLIIPGIYFMVRLAFASTAYVDRQFGVKQSLEYSWHLVKGRLFWSVFLVLLVEIVLIVVGSVAFLIGLLVTYPLAMLLITHLYRALDKHYRATKQTEMNQPAQA